MIQIIPDIAGFGVVLCLTSYGLGIWLRSKLRYSIFNPLLIAVILIVIFLSLCDIEYNQFQNNSSQLSYLLTPATVSLAIPLSKQIKILKNDFKAILIGCMCGVFASLGYVLGLSILFHLTFQEYTTLLPKSITTAIGAGISEELNGNSNITIAAIIITGILGNIFAEWICRITHIKSKVARGVAIGCSSHAIGTAKAVQMGEVEGAVSSLSLILTGIFTVLLAPIFAQIVI